MTEISGASKEDREVMFFRLNMGKTLSSADR